MADTCACQVEVEGSLICVIYQHILQYFLGFVALKFSATDSRSGDGSDIAGIGVQNKTGGVDEAEEQAIRHHAG